MKKKKYKGKGDRSGRVLTHVPACGQHASSVFAAALSVVGHRCRRLRVGLEGQDCVKDGLDALALRLAHILVEAIVAHAITAHRPRADRVRLGAGVVDHGRQLPATGVDEPVRDLV